MSIRSILTRAAAFGAAVALTATGMVDAAAARRHHANTFSGHCALSGTISFVPPMTNTPHDLTQYARATGTCTGTFTGHNGRTHDLNNAPVSYRATEFAPNASCQAATDSGSGRLVFPYGAIRFTVTETRVEAGVAVMLKGARGGSAAGQANVSPSANPEQIIAECAGSGVPSAPFEAQAMTTPSISG
jgi:hypothetical protein